MNENWPGICAAAALALLLALVIRYKVHAFISLLGVSLILGLAAGLPPGQVVDEISAGIGGILRDVALLLAFGALLGRMLELSGAAELIARRIIQALGERNASLALLLASFLIGIPMLFNVGFLLLIPIVWRMQRETNQSLLRFFLPMMFSLGLTHSLVPPHPGIVGAVQAIATAESANRVMVETLIFGIALSFPLALIGWFGPGRIWADRQFVTPPENMSVASDNDAKEPPIARSLALALIIVLAPLVLSIAGFGANLLHTLKLLPDRMTWTLFDVSETPNYLRWLNHSPLSWLLFFGKPTVALGVPTVLAYVCYGLGRGWSHAKMSKITSESMLEVGAMTFLFGAAGGFKQVIVATRVGDYLAQQMMQLPLTPVAVAFCMSAIIRAALGSATASILTASALLAGLAAQRPGFETLIVLSAACGVTVGTQPADSGFWMLKEYGNLSTSDIMLRVNGCRLLMAVCGLGILLIAEAVL